MRARLLRDKPARSPWDLKLREGGLIEIEFIVQSAQLIAREPSSANTIEALHGLSARGALPQADAQALAGICEDYAALTQLMRAAHGDGFDPEGASAPFAARMCAALNVDGLAALAEGVQARAQTVRALFTRHVGPLQ
jgi:glutamate-ammonia-ligase adenylyltransferase